MAHFNPMSVSLSWIGSDLKSHGLRHMTAVVLILFQGMVLRELEMAMSWEDKMMIHLLWGLCLASAI